MEKDFSVMDCAGKVARNIAQLYQGKGFVLELDCERYKCAEDAHQAYGIHYFEDVMSDKRKKVIAESIPEKTLDTIVICRPTRQQVSEVYTGLLGKEKIVTKKAVENIGLYVTGLTPQEYAAQENKDLYSRE